MKGSTLRRLRKKAGLTGGALAARLGVAPNTVWCWERGVEPITTRTANHVKLEIERILSDKAAGR